MRQAQVSDFSLFREGLPVESHTCSVTHVVTRGP